MKRAILSFLVISLFACQDDDMPPPTPTNMPAIGLITDLSIEVGSMARDYHLFIPSDYNNQPVVILLHGNRSSHDDLIGASNVTSPFETWLSVAEREDIILVVPNGTLGENDERGWNDCRSDAAGNPTSDDVRFIKELLDYVQETYNYNSKRIYATGISNGGHLAFRLAQEIPESIAAYAAIAAAIPASSQCTDSSVPVSALIMNGTEDPISPYEGGAMASDRGMVLSTIESVNYWVARNKTSTTPSTENIVDIDQSDDSQVIKHTYQNGTANTEVVHYEIVNGGHAEPSIEERYRDFFLRIVGNQNADIEMSEEVWDFFKDKSK